MKIPKKYKELIRTAEYEFDQCVNHEQYASGYTIKVFKPSERTLIPTFRRQIEELVSWANRQCDGTAFILRCPSRTFYCKQYAIVTVFDPVMQQLEKHMAAAHPRELTKEREEEE